MELCLWTAGERAAISNQQPLTRWTPASPLPCASPLIERIDDPPLDY